MSIGLEGRQRAGVGWRGSGTVYITLTSAGANEPTRSSEVTTAGVSRNAITLNASSSTGVVSQSGDVVWTASGTVTVNGYMITTASAQESSDSALRGNLLAYGAISSRTLNSGDTLTISSYTLTPEA